MTTTPETDPLLLAARKNCKRECPGPTPRELAGLDRPHSCERTLAAETGAAPDVAAAFVGDTLAAGAELARQREEARAQAEALQGEVDNVRAVLMLALDGCPDHDTHRVECPVCVLDWWARYPDDQLAGTEHDALQLHLHHRLTIGAEEGRADE